MQKQRLIEYACTLFIILFLCGCKTYPSTGYIDGVIDSCTFEITAGDSAEVKTIKTTAKKVLEKAQKEAAVVSEIGQKATKEAARKSSEVRALVGLLASVLLVGGGAVFLLFSRKR